MMGDAGGYQPHYQTYAHYSTNPYGAGPPYLSEASPQIAQYMGQVKLSFISIQSIDNTIRFCYNFFILFRSMLRGVDLHRRRVRGAPRLLRD